MNVVLILVAVALSIVFYFVGRATVSHKQQLDNQAVIQERDKIQSEIKVAAQELAQTQEKRKSVEASIEAAEIAAKKKEAEALRLVRDHANELQQKYDDMLGIQIADQRKLLKDLSVNLQEQSDRLFQKKQIEYDALKNELEKIKATRDATIEASRKEREIADAPQDYQIHLAADEQHDIKYIESIKDKLFHPETLGKFVWNVFLQKKMKNLCSKILGEEQVCGIYKLTDQATGEAYVGQSKNVATRWTQHVKCGVGASPVSAANALYSAMWRDGVDSFTFELLESCPAEQLDEKEAFYIELYSTDTLGLNSKRGNQ